MGPADFNPYCVNAPVDSRLPGGGGNQLCGLYDVTPAKFGLNQGLVTQSSNYGKETIVNNYVGFSIASRFGNGIRVGGGVDTGRSETNSCFVVDNPQQRPDADTITGNTGGSTLTGATGITATPSYCHAVIPWLGNLQVKANGSYPLPFGFTVNATYQNTPGPQVLANYNAPNSAIASSLGRNLAACGTRVVCTATLPVPLIQPGAVYERRRNQLDLRFVKAIKLGPRIRFQGNFDVYNVLNANPVLSLQTTYGPQWLKPTRVLDPRLAQVGARFEF